MQYIDDVTLSRREIIKATLWGIAGSALLPTVANASVLRMPNVGAFNISFRNQHTGEIFSGAYRVGDKYLPEAFDQINHVLRDFRNNEVFPIDPRVIDIMYMTRKKTGIEAPLEVLSGYRSPSTNAKLSRVSTGVAKNSLHMTGQAVDFRLPGYSTRRLQNVAVSLQAGGVGYYKGSNFVHVDTGRIRHW
jgi:uncharacterized protein YcbK (DUF882 family)